MAGEVVVPMPALGAASLEATVVRWLRSPGDYVSAGDLIAEIVTDKVSDDLRTPVDGVLGTPLVLAGQVAAVGTPLVVIVAAIAASGPVLPLSPPGGGAGGGGAGDASRSSPLVRRLAAENGIPLNEVIGSGPGGRVTKDDIVAAIAAFRRGAVPPAPFPPLPRSEEGPRPSPLSPRESFQQGAHARITMASFPTGTSHEELLPVSPLRQAIAANLVRAIHDVPHAWTLVEVDASSLLACRDDRRDGVRTRTGVALTTFTLVVHALARVVATHPLLNGSWRDGPGGSALVGDAGGRVAVRRHLNLGIAVARPGGGLVVPVIADADQLDLDATAVALERVVAGARSATLPPDAYHGATFTLNNTGALGSVASMPIPPAGTSAILAFEAIVKRAVVVGGDAIAVRPMVNLCLTFDHRVMDGQEACAFMQDARRALEGLGSGTALH